MCMLCMTLLVREGTFSNGTDRLKLQPKFLSTHSIAVSGMSIDHILHKYTYCCHLRLQVVLSHTPFRELVGRLGQVPLLAVGRGSVAEVAADYGFRRVVTTAQIAAAMPAAVPFAAPGRSPSLLLPFTCVRSMCFTLWHDFWVCFKGNHSLN
jgi:hypothetical protein